MRRCLVILCTLGYCASVLAPAYAAEAPENGAGKKQYNAADKFIRGLVNIVTAPLELPRRIRRRTDGDNTVRGWSVGTAQGVGFATTRLLVGAYEVLTFPISKPDQYAPVLEPEYVWDHDE